MKAKVKKWINESVAYLNFGLWIGIGVGIGFVTVMVIYGFY